MKVKSFIIAFIIAAGIGLTGGAQAGKLCNSTVSGCTTPTATPGIPDGRTRIIVTSDYFRCADDTYGCR